MTWESERIPAILNVWFGGSEAGDAISDVVFGDVNPSGKLPVSMPRNVGQIPLYYNHLSTGRPPHQPWTGFQQYISNYVDSPNTPLYPFGFGMSYTTFAYSDFKLSATEMDMDGKIRASVTVTNTGDMAGDEIVQFYTRDLVGSISRPVQELKTLRAYFAQTGRKSHGIFRHHRRRPQVLQLQSRLRCRARRVPHHGRPFKHKCHNAEIYPYFAKT